jgi:group I intron endonuclease
MQEGYIYKITNPKGSIYIGSTNNIKRRKEDYKYLRCKGQIKIYRSIKKYGFENHKFEIITTCNLENIYFFENYYGLVYNVLDSKHLNLKLPKSDDRFISVSEETRKKIGLSNKGKIISDKQKLKMSYNLKKWSDENGHSMLGKIPWNKGKEFLKGELNPMFGKIRTEEWKQKQSKICKEKNCRGKNHFASKIVLDFINGIYYESVKEASDLLKIKYSTLKCKLNKSKKSNINLIYV